MAEGETVSEAQVTQGDKSGGYPTDAYDREGAKALREALSDGTIVSQGPMGTVLMGEPGGEGIPAAAWNVSEPQTVERVHALYETVGAQLLITNTFQASSPALVRDGVRRPMTEVNDAAVRCALAASPRLLVGSMGPCGLEWFAEDAPEYRAARAAYRDQAHALLCAGVGGILLETFTSIRDIQPALAGVGDVAAGMPVLASFAVDEAGDLIVDHLNIEAAVSYAVKHGADAVGVNCCSLSAADRVVSRMARAVDAPLMVRPNVGDPRRSEDGDLVWEENPAAFARAALSWRDAGVRVVGACCGATAKTIWAMADALGVLDEAPARRL